MPLTGQVKQAFDTALERLKTFYDGQRPYDPVDNPGGFRRGGNVVNFAPSLQDVAEVGSGIGAMAAEVAQAADLVSGKTTAALAAATRAESAASAAEATLDGKAVRGSTSVNDSDYQILQTDVQVVMRTLTAPRAIYLPDVDTYPAGQDLVIFDGSGNCSAERPILIYPGPGTGDAIAYVDSVLILEQPYFPLRFRRGTANLWVRMS